MTAFLSETCDETGRRARVARWFLVATAAVGLAAGVQRCAEATPTVVFGNLGAAGTGTLAPATNASVSNARWLAHGFTVGGTNTKLTSVVLGLADSETPASTARLRIFANSSGSPAGDALATVTKQLSSTAASLQTFNFGNVALTSGSSYWIVLSVDESDSLINWQFNNRGDLPATQNTSGWTPLSDETILTENSGSSWVFSGVNRPASISITAVPEPGALPLAGIGLATAAWAARRMRRRSLADDTGAGAAAGADV